MAPVNAIKFVLDGDKRRVNLADLGGSISYERLCDVVMTAYGAETLAQGFAFQYLDDEDELITMGSDIELEEALRLADVLERPSLQLQVVPELELGASASQGGRGNSVAHSTGELSSVGWELQHPELVGDELASNVAQQESQEGDDNDDGDRDDDAKSEGSDGFFLVETASQASHESVDELADQVATEQVDEEAVNEEAIIDEVALELGTENEELEAENEDQAESESQEQDEPVVQDEVDDADEQCVETPAEEAPLAADVAEVDVLCSAEAAAQEEEELKALVQEAEAEEREKQRMIDEDVARELELEFVESLAAQVAAEQFVDEEKPQNESVPEPESSSSSSSESEASSPPPEPSSTPPPPLPFGFPDLGDLAEGLMRHPVLRSLRTLLEAQMQEQQTRSGAADAEDSPSGGGAASDAADQECDPLRDLLVLCANPAVVRALQDAVASPALTPLMANAASLYVERPAASVHEYVALLQQAPALLPVLARVTTEVPELVFSFPRIVAAVSELIRRANGAKSCDCCCCCGGGEQDSQDNNNIGAGCKCGCKCCKCCKPKSAQGDEEKAAVVKPVHHGVQCDGCEGEFDSNVIGHIVGIRYKSAVKDDFDLCETCEASGVWNKSHGPFLKILYPSMAPAGLLCVLKGDENNDEEESDESCGPTRHRHHRHRGHGHHQHHGRGRGGHHGRGRSHHHHHPRHNEMREAKNAMREALRTQTRPNRFAEGHVDSNADRFAYAQVPQILKQRFAERATRQQRFNNNADSKMNWRETGDASPPATATPTATTTTKCPSGHPLVGHVTKDSRFVCDVCNQRVRRGVNMLGCRDCDYDACWKCANASSTASATPNVTPNPAPAAVAPRAAGPAVRPQARFVCDVTLADGSVVAPGAAVVKTWRVINSGKVSWPLGCRVVCVGGDRMGAPFAGVEVPAHPVGSACDVSVHLRAPTKPGRYVGYWRLITAENQRFGHRFWVDVSVAGSVRDHITAQVLDPFRQAMDAFGQRSTAAREQVQQAQQQRPSIRVGSTPPDAVETTGDAAPMATPAEAQANAPEAAAVSEEAGQANVVPIGVVLETPSPALSEPIVVGHDVEGEQALLAKYETQIVQLAELGFFDLEENVQLLERFHGSVQATVAQLLESNNA